MSITQHIKDLIRNFLYNILKIIPDSLRIKIRFYKKLGYRLNLKNPKTFCEKLQRLKLHDRNPEYTKMVDKYEVKNYIAKKIGIEYVVPYYGIYNNVEEINWDQLPNEFVLKCTHNSGGMVICNNKKNLDKEKAKKGLKKSLSRNYFYWGRERPYKNVKPRIIAEKLLKDNNKDGIIDYKFFCFNGEPKFMYISNDHGASPHTDFFDMEYKQLNIQMRDPKSKKAPQKPTCFDKMIALSKELSKGIPHLRVDFYYIDNHIYIGELTFYTWGGFCLFKPSKRDIILGEWIKLPKK